MVKRFVLGVYDSVDEAKRVYDALIQKGIPASGLQVTADEDTLENYADESYDPYDPDETTDVTAGVVPGTNTNEAAATTANIGAGYSNFVVMDASDNRLGNEVDLSSYKKDIKDGKVLVIVDETYEGDALSLDLSKLNETSNLDDSVNTSDAEKKTTEVVATPAEDVTVTRDRDVVSADTDDITVTRDEDAVPHPTGEVTVTKDEEVVRNDDVADNAGSKSSRFVTVGRNEDRSTIDSLTDAEKYGHAGKNYDKSRQSTAHTVSTRGINSARTKDKQDVRYDRPDEE